MTRARIQRSTLVGSVGLILLALALARLPLAVVGLGAGAAALAATLLLAPEWAVFLLAFAVPFGSLAPLSVGGAQLTAADLLLGLAWALYLARGVARRRIELRAPPLSLPLVVFLLAAAVSFTVARSLADSATEWLKWAELLAAYWLVAQFFDETRARRLVAAMLLAGLAEAALGAYQYFYRVGPEGFLLFGGANLRAYGTFEQPNPYAGYLGLLLPLAFGTALGLALALWRVWRARANGPHRTRVSLREAWQFVPLLALAVVALGAMLAALFFSYSRGAWIAVAAALAATALLTLVRSRRAAVWLAALVLVVLAVVALGEIQVVPNIVAERFATVSDYLTFDDVRGVRANDENFALVERRAHWQAALGMFEDSPWLGVGFGNYAVAYPDYALPRWADPLGHAHNYYLNVLAETGVVGFVPFIVWCAAAFLIAWRAARRSRGWRAGLLAGVFGMFVALSIHNFFDNLFVHAMYIHVGLALGLVEALNLTTADGRGRPAGE